MLVLKSAKILSPEAIVGKISELEGFENGLKALETLKLELFPVETLKVDSSMETLETESPQSEK